jgi:hypothetical protein
MSCCARTAALLAAMPLLLAAATAPAQVFPPKPTVHDDVYWVLNFRCPYPSAAYEPQVFQEGGRLVVEFVTEGSVCFSGPEEELHFAVRLGRLPAGRHEVEFRSAFTTGGGVTPFAGPPQVRAFRVLEQTPVRVSGLWFDPAAPKQGLSFLLAPNGELVANWFTYAGNGEPVWFSGQVTADGLSAVIPMGIASGGRFAQPGGQPELTEFGTLEIDFLECGRARALWRSNVPGFTTRTLNLVQLSAADGIGNCLPDAILQWRGWR